MSTQVHGGGCLCGGVRYEVAGPMRRVVYCHCRLCRVQGSIATVGVPRRSLLLLVRDTLRSYESSRRARRWFCGACGAAMYWDPIGEPFVAIFAGSLDQPTGLDGMAHIYVSERPDYYCIVDDLKQYMGPMHTVDGAAQDGGVERGPEDTGPLGRIGDPA